MHNNWVGFEAVCQLFRKCGEPLGDFVDNHIIFFLVVCGDEDVSALMMSYCMCFHILVVVEHIMCAEGSVDLH
jgi:hypothetical protein